MELKLIRLAARLFATRLRRGAAQVLRRRRPLSVLPPLEDKTFLFVCGLHRSGTSILNRLLREHPDVSGFDDTGAAENEGQHLQSVMPRDYVHGGHGVFAFDLDAHLTEHSALNTPENRARLLGEWCAYLDLERRVFVEKSPPNLVRTRLLQALAPRPRFVFIVRHPLPVALASRRSTGGPLLLLLAHWQIAHAIMRADLPHLELARVIRYEDMIARPAECLGQISGLLDIEPFVPAEAIVDHNAKYFVEWERERERYEGLLEALYPRDDWFMDAMGYSLQPPYVRERAPAPAAFTPAAESEA